MGPSPYLLSVTSRPTVVSDSLWQQWYTEEHLSDLVNSRTSTRATFYTEVTHQLNNAANYPRKFLALYQTDFAEPLKTENYTTLRTTSELFGKEGGKEGIQDNGDFDARNYELIQEFDPTKIGEVPSPYILTVEMHPQDASDFDEWYREEHLDLLSKIPGYRRCLRYKLGPPTPAALSKGISDPAKGLVESDGFVPAYLAIHEVDDLVAGFGGKEAEQANATPWTIKHIQDSKVFVARGWKLVHQEGY